MRSGRCQAFCLGKRRSQIQQRLASYFCAHLGKEIVLLFVNVMADILDEDRDLGVETLI